LGEVANAMNQIVFVLLSPAILPIAVVCLIILYPLEKFEKWSNRNFVSCLYKSSETYVNNQWHSTTWSMSKPPEFKVCKALRGFLNGLFGV